MLSSINTQPKFNRRRCLVVTAPSTEPVSIDEIKLAGSGIPDEHDTVVTRMGKAARQFVEGYLNRSLITQSRKLTMDGWPATGSSVADYVGNGQPYPSRGQSALVSNGINLPFGPVISITHVKYYDTTNTLQTMSSDNYFLDSAGSRLVLSDGCSWPSGLRSQAAVEITYGAGYGGASAVPDAIKEVIVQLALMLYEARGCGCDLSKELPANVSTLLAPYKLSNSFGVTF